MHIKLTNGTPETYTIGQLRRDNPQVSFPKSIPDDTLAEYDVYPCAETTQPTITYAQNFAKAFEQVEGAWMQTWIITDASAEEIAERTAQQWQQVRDQRNELLAACDWTQLADAPVDDLAWASYRQALRDITTQTDPFNIVWPVAP